MSHPEGPAALDAHVSGGFDAARDAWAPWLPLANFEATCRSAWPCARRSSRRRGVLATGLGPPARRHAAAGAAASSDAHTPARLPAGTEEFAWTSA